MRLPRVQDDLVAPRGIRRAQEALALVLACLLCLSGCRSASSREPVETPSADIIGPQAIAPTLPSSPAVDRLRARAEQQRTAGAADADSVAGLPPPWEPSSAPLAPDVLVLAQQRLTDVLDAVRARPLVEDPIEPVAVSSEDHDEALRLYARARLALLSQDHDAALNFLEDASRLDPSTAAVWEALGEAQFAAGLRGTALASLERAARLGIDNPRTWSVLGLEALRRRNTDQALRWLTAARDGMGRHTDPAAIAWLEVSLGEILLDMQRLRAGAEMLEQALARMPAAETTAEFRSEYATLVRRRPQITVRIGDAYAWLSEWETAAAAYDRAGAELELELAQPIEDRRIACLERLNRSAEAALVMLEAIQRRQGMVNDAQIAVSRQLAQREPAFADALQTLPEHLAQPTPAQCSRLALLQLAVSGDAPLSDRLALLPPGVPLLSDHVVELIGNLPAPQRRWLAAQALTTARPDDALTIADTLYAGALLSPAELNDMVSDADVLSACVRLRLETPDRRADLLSLAGRAGGLPVAAATAIATGRWDVLPALLSAADQAEAPIRWRTQLAALRPLEAWATWQAWQTNHQPSASQLLEGARIAAAAGEPVPSVDLLLEAQRVDPYLEQAYGLLVTALLTNGADMQSPEAQGALQNLRTRLPGCATLQALTILDLRRQNFNREVVQGTMRLIDRLAAPAAADYTGLLGPWERAHEQGDKALLDESEAWLRARLDPQRPEPGAALAMAHLLALQSRDAEALELLSSPALAGAAAVQRERESLLRSLARTEEADQAAIDRLSHEHLSVIELFELARLHAARGRPVAPTLARLNEVPADIRLTEAEATAMLSLASQLQGRILAAPDDDARAQAAADFVAAAGFGIDHGLPMREPIHRLRLRYAAEQKSTPYTELIRISDQYTQAVGRIGNEAFGETYAVLMQAGRTQDVIRWGVHVVTSLDELDEERWMQIVLPLGSLGTIDTINLAIERLQDRGQLEAAVGAVQNEEAAADQIQTDPRAELCYVLAGVAAARERDTQAILVYQRALEFQPDHPWVCNDYGYMLAEAGRQLDEAERLLTIAYERLPDRASVLDSIGWLRYKQGRFLDQDGLPGALTLLTRAGASAEGGSNPTIQDHIGDTLWMTGDADKARAAWLLAEQFYLERVRAFRTPDERRLPQYTRVQQQLRDVRNKLSAIELKTADPPVAPSAGQRLDKAH